VVTPAGCGIAPSVLGCAGFECSEDERQGDHLGAAVAVGISAPMGSMDPICSGKTVEDAFATELTGR